MTGGLHDDGPEIIIGIDGGAQARAGDVRYQLAAPAGETTGGPWVVERVQVVAVCATRADAERWALDSTEQRQALEEQIMRSRWLTALRRLYLELERAAPAWEDLVTYPLRRYALVEQFAAERRPYDRNPEELALNFDTRETDEALGGRYWLSMHDTPTDAFAMTHQEVTWLPRRLVDLDTGQQWPLKRTARRENPLERAQRRADWPGSSPDPEEVYGATYADKPNPRPQEGASN